MSMSDTPVVRQAITRRRLVGTAAAATALATGLGTVPRMGRAQEDVSGEITYWHHFTSDSEMAGLEQVTAMFNEQYPNVTVNSENIPNADYMTQFTTAAVSGSLPDTAMAAVDRIPDMLALGGLTDLSTQFNGWEGRLDIPEALMTGATVEGQIVGVPMFLFVDWLYYRSDWFDELGLTPPNTWDEFREVARPARLLAPESLARDARRGGEQVGAGPQPGFR